MSVKRVEHWRQKYYIFSPLIVAIYFMYYLFSRGGVSQLGHSSDEYVTRTLKHLKPMSIKRVFYNTYIPLELKLLAADL